MVESHESEQLEALSRRLRWVAKLAFFLVLCHLASKYLARPQHFGVLDYAILPFHEFGHLVFRMFGQTPAVAGGTIVQVGMPLGFAIYFACKRRDYFASLFSAFWMSQTLLNVSVYMRDARIMVMPLFGNSDDLIHDWNYLFGKMKSLHRAEIIADKVEFLGRFSVWVSLLAMGIWLLSTSPFWNNPFAFMLTPALESDDSEREE